MLIKVRFIGDPLLNQEAGITDGRLIANKEYVVLHLLDTLRFVLVDENGDIILPSWGLSQPALWEMTSAVYLGPVVLK